MDISEFHYNHILKKDVWHELEIKALLNADSSIYDLIRAAIVAKTLIPICTVQISEDGASVYGFKATDIIHWAKLKGYAIPDELKDFNTTSQAVEDVGLVSHAGGETKERELTAWLRETWIKEGNLGGTAFFTRLKKYVNIKGSPITAHYGAGNDAGFSWKTSAGTTGEMKKKTIQTKVSEFKSNL